jgi:SAM-dependent methyltransferase
MCPKNTPALRGFDSRDMSFRFLNFSLDRHRSRRTAIVRKLSDRQEDIRAIFDRLAPEREFWIERNRYFYTADQDYMRFLVPKGLKILEIGCGNGHLIYALRPSRGVGLDVSEAMIEVARRQFSDFEFHVGNAEDDTMIEQIDGPFDVIILSDTIGYLENCEDLLISLHRLSTPDTRLIIAYYSRLWDPLLSLAERLGKKMPSVPQNWISTDDTVNLLSLADFEVIRRDWWLLVPKRLLGLGTLINRYIGPLPGIRRLSLRNYIVARPVGRSQPSAKSLSVTVVIPCRNESGNIENAVRRLPRFVEDIEIIFVEGNSRDDTFAVCERVRDSHSDLDIKVMRQDGVGKGDAVRKGLAAARGDILMILDADLTVPPESLPRFYRPIATGRAEFVNGTRLVYPMAGEAMQFLNRVANRAFAVVFSFLLNQRFTDTLCGTKALRRRDYEKIAANRAYFGDFDPFGDFDLLFGAARLNLKIVEVPIRYDARRYGQTQISRFRHGWMLLRMVFFAWRKLKVIQ